MPEPDIPRHELTSHPAEGPACAPVCPECDTRLAAQSGCLVCRQCGWSRCAA